MRKTMVCLANSRKVGGRCVAGKSHTEPIRWIRPVSDRPDEEISLTEMQYSNGGSPRLLDIVVLDVLRAKPNRFQTENFLIDSSVKWSKTAEFAMTDLDAICDHPDTLWNAHESSYWGKNDRIRSEASQDLNDSLVLIRIEDGMVVVRDEDAVFGHSHGHKKVRIEFELGGTTYRLPVTDPVIESRYQSEVENSYSLKSPSFMCVSLGLPHTDNYCYLFAASIIE